MGELRTRVPVTMLNGMASADFEESVRRQAALGLRQLDLKDAIWGHGVEQLGPREAMAASALIQNHGLTVHCLSSVIGHTSLVEGESAFRARHGSAFENLLQVAAVLRPTAVRLLAPCRDAGTVDSIDRSYPWVFTIYREWIDRLHDRGYQVLIENETHGCMLGSVGEVVAFFAGLDRPAARYTWDVQNLWEVGTFPSMEVYRELRPLIGALHLKGGRGNGRLEWASSLADASWPVREITQAAVDDGVVAAICLNPSHGRRPDGYDGWEVARQDLDFLRREVRGLEI